MEELSATHVWVPQLHRPGCLPGHGVCVSGGVRQREEMHRSFRYRPVGVGGCSPAAVQVSHSMQLGWDTLSGLLYKIHRHPIGGERSFQEKSFLLGVGDLPGRN